jgi:hypothetical protein
MRSTQRKLLIKCCGKASCDKIAPKKKPPNKNEAILNKTTKSDYTSKKTPTRLVNEANRTSQTLKTKKNPNFIQTGAVGNEADATDGLLSNLAETSTEIISAKSESKEKSRALSATTESSFVAISGSSTAESSAGIAFSTEIMIESPSPSNQSQKSDTYADSNSATSKIFELSTSVSRTQSIVSDGTTNPLAKTSSLTNNTEKTTQVSANSNTNNFDSSTKITASPTTSAKITTISKVKTTPAVRTKGYTTVTTRVPKVSKK